MSTLAPVQGKKPGVEFKRVLVATDFSEPSTKALTFAVAIARRYGSALSVVHAVPPEPREQIPLEPLPKQFNRRRREAEEKMKRLGQESWVGEVNHHLLVDQGTVWDVLASVLRSEEIDLLVLGTHGRGGLKKAVVGSVAEEVLRRATCPVLTIGPRVPPLEAIDFKRILFATDFGPGANKAFPVALSLAKEYRAKLVLLHMMSPIASADLGPAGYGPSTYGAEEYIKWQQTIREESIRKLKELIPADADLASEPEFIAGVDFLPEGILDIAGAHKCDLIVMGADRTSSPRLSSHLPWALTHEIIAHARCPVLTLTD